MKTIFSGAISALLLVGLSWAQSGQIPSGTAAQPQPATPPDSQQIPDSSAQPPQRQPATQGPAIAERKAKIAPGSVIPVELTKTIDAKKAKTGDEVVAKVTQDMKTSNGDVLVPKDTKIVGHVTEAQPRSKEQKESQMGIAFDRAVLKDGNQMDLPMSIQAIIGRQNENQNAPAGNDQASNQPSGGMPAGGTGAGRSGSMGGSTPPPQPSAPDTSASQSQAPGGGAPQITGQTRGVIGISNLTLTSAPNGSHGSVMTSEKNNVKLESGTMMLLKVNQ